MTHPPINVGPEGSGLFVQGTPEAVAFVLALKDHARLTQKKIEMFFKRRGWTTGKKKWERELLTSALAALGEPAPG